MHFQAVEESGLGYWALYNGGLQKVCEQVNLV